jgi:CDGSH-type Zn-finger protein/ferredoxin
LAAGSCELPTKMNAEITPLPNGPLKAERLKALKNAHGETIDTSETVFLCRCGSSKNKPYCDGSHSAVKFSDRRLRKKEEPISEFVGKDVTVIDDVGLCAHAGYCVDGAPETFFTKEGGRRVSHPDASDAAVVIEAIRRCPSGALLYKLGGKLVHEYSAETEVLVEKDGPLRVQRAKLNGARPATEDHYTLCRCGASANKPFCDGMHATVKFRDGSAD